MASYEKHVNGPAEVLMQGSTGPLLQVGFTVGGVDLDFPFKWRPITSDLSPMVPLEEQYMATDAWISGRLIDYDGTNIEQIQGQLFDNAIAVGQMGTIGSLLIQQGLGYRVLIKSFPAGQGVSQTSEPCYNFLRCSVHRFHVVNGTEAKEVDFLFHALPYGPSVTGGDTTDLVLYNTVCV